jgi:ABC-type Na+ efflux pump permease subunit
MTVVEPTPAAAAPTPAAGRGRAPRVPIDWQAVWAVVNKDVTAVRRSKAVVLPMLLVPVLMLVGLPLFISFASARNGGLHIDSFLSNVPHHLAAPILSLPPKQQAIVLVLGFLVAPLFLIVPLMVSAVLAADAFAGEKERKTLETLMHLPISDRDLYLSKLLSAFIPSVVISWVGFAIYLVVSNASAWPIMHRIFLPTWLWAVVIFWVAPAVAALGLGVMVRVSARARTSQEANQLGGTVILPIVILVVGQTSFLLLAQIWVSLTVGAVVWAIAIWLNLRGARRFTRDMLATRL